MMDDGSASGDASQNPDPLASLCNRKEREWREAEETRVARMSEQLVLNASNLSELQARHKTLKDDFKYNLKLMDERDRELAQFDTVYADTLKIVLTTYTHHPPPPPHPLSFPSLCS
jgi:hypothetical protein